MTDGSGDDGRRTLGWSWIVTALLALVVAFVVTSPVWRFRGDAGDAFRGVEFMGASDGEQTVTQLRKILDGTFGRENDVLYEWSRGPQNYSLLSHDLYLLPYRVVGGDLHAYVAWMTGICAAIQFVLFVAVARVIGASRWTAHAAALACCLAPFLWSFHGHERWLFAPSRLQIDFLPLYRPVNPSFTSVFLWGGLLVLLRWLARPNVVGWIALAALAAFGHDIYPPVFTTFGAVLAGAAVVLACRRRRRDAAWLVAAGAVGLAWNFRLLVGYAAVPGGSTGSAAEGNVNSVAFHAPILTADVLTLLAVAAVALLVNWRRELTAAALVVAVAAPIGMLLQFNQHLVTGRIYQPFHYDWMYSVPLIWLGLAALAPRLETPARAVGAWAARHVRAIDAAGAVADLVVVGLAFGGTLTAPVLRALGVIRSDVVERPMTLAGVGLFVVGAAWGMARLLGAGRLRLAAALVCTAIGLAAFFEGWNIQKRGYLRRRDEHLAFQRIAPALDWVRKNGTHDTVVACGTGTLPRLFASHVGCDVLVSLETIFYGKPPDDEYVDRRLVWLALYGVTRDELAAQLDDKGRFHFDVFKWRTFGPPPPKIAFLSYGVNPSPLPADAMEKVLAKYDAVLALTPAQRLARYRLDCVLWSDFDPPQGFRDPGATYPLEVVVDEPGCRLYRVAPGR